jgi:hypothetical protein
VTIFLDWQPKHTELFGRHTIKLHHSLPETGLFTDEALAELIGRYPRSHYDLAFMGRPDEPRHLWREGELGTASGHEQLDAIKAGRMWINMRRVMEVDKRYADLLAQIFAEMEGHVPGLKTFKHNLGILVSSPKAQVYYHCDVPGQSLWQIRGRKRVYIYPNTAPFLTQQQLEGIVLNETEEEVRYEPWYDDYAEIHDLEPGEMLHWALNGPHRVVNHDVLNVSVTTEHWTPAIRKSYAVHYANGVLRRRLGFRNLSTDQTGLGVYAKAAIVAGYKYSGLQRIREVKRVVDFRIDPAAPQRMVDIPAYTR